MERTRSRGSDARVQRPSGGRSASTRTGPPPTTRGRPAAIRPPAFASRRSGCGHAASTSRCSAAAGGTDVAVAEALAELGYADCTATGFRPSYLATDAPRLGVGEPCYVELPSGRRLLEL